ncbi:MAG: sigma-70 family RNA polymerase sigma factor [Thermodesulfobacteriota bacterium]
MDEPVIQSNHAADPDKALVKSFQQGNQSSFERLVHIHKRRIFNICYRFLGDFSEANDIAQETFIRAFRSIHQFRFEAAFSTWLCRIAVNTCKNRLNSKSYRQEKRLIRFRETPDSKLPDTMSEIADPNPLPLSRLVEKEKEILIEKAIAALPPDQKTTVVLRDIEGMSYDEIAGVTGTNIGTVKSRLARGRESLKHILKEYL